MKLAAALLLLLLALAAAGARADGESDEGCANPDGLPTLHCWPSSTCSRRAIFALAEAGLKDEIDYRLQTVVLSKGQQRLPEHLALQPFGKVPVWEESTDFVLYESRAVAEYHLEGTALIPSAKEARAVMAQWVSVEHGYFAPAFMPIYMNRVMAPKAGKESDESVVLPKIEELKPVLKILEARIQATGDYFVPGSFTFADLTYAPYFEMFGPCGLKTLLEADYPSLSSWWSRVSSRPAWQYTLSLTPKYVK